MLSLMTVRCRHCSYENNPQYQFCGMCGATLETPATAERRETAPPRVSGPSFLGLADEPSRSGDYLLDDEPQARRRVGRVILLLLLVGAGYAAWRWQAQWYPWAAQTYQTLTARPAPANPPAPSTASPAQPPATTSEAHTTTPEPQPAAGAATEKTDTTQQTSPEPLAPSAVPQTNPADSVPPPKSSRADESAADETPAKEAVIATAPEPAVKKKTAVAKLTQPERRPEPGPSDDDKLVADGERYLYGTGVRENCTRAQLNLRTAALHSNPKAQSVLGTMYATGHCVSRDLPAAYRWFAKALRQDPGNARVQRDLEILWRQMSADERQIAMRSPR